MRLFVTGGAGFIESNFIKWVLREHDDVRVTDYDKLTYAGNLASLRDLSDSDRYEFVRGDLNDASTLDDVLPGHDAVVNFAAESHVDRSILGAAEFITTNVQGANTIFDAARRADIGNFLHISTDETYGSIDEGSFREGDALEPNSPYSASKAAADLLARAYRVTHGYPITVTRSSNNFGPFQYPEKVIPLFVTNLMAGEKVPLYGTGENVRDWMFVDDNVRAIWAVLTEGEPGGLYNIGAGNEISNVELTHRILAHFDLGEEMIEHVTDRPGHDLRYSIDTSKLRELGWKPQRSFDDALDVTITWYRDNRWWWEPLKSRDAFDRGVDDVIEAPGRLEYEEDGA